MHSGVPAAVTWRWENFFGAICIFDRPDEYEMGFIFFYVDVSFVVVLSYEIHIRNNVISQKKMFY